MKIQKIFEMIRVKLTYAESQPWIRKPIAWTLYQVWKYADSHEKERKMPEMHRDDTGGCNS